MICGCCSMVHAGVMQWLNHGCGQTDGDVGDDLVVDSDPIYLMISTLCKYILDMSLFAIWYFNALFLHTVQDNLDLCRLVKTENLPIHKQF